MTSSFETPAISLRAVHGHRAAVAAERRNYLAAVGLGLTGGTLDLG